MTAAEKIAKFVWGEEGLDPDETLFSDHMTREEFAAMCQEKIDQDG